MVPYMHKGEAIPIRDAGISPNRPSLLLFIKARKE
jgi:hypothetical protein